MNASPVVDLTEGLEQVAQAGLYDTDDPDSHVRVVIEQVRRDGLFHQDREVVDLWLAQNDRGESVGMALVTRERQEGRWWPLLNLYVRPDARGQGVGTDLVLQVRTRYPRLEGHYTPSSMGLYLRLGVDDFSRHRFQDRGQRQRLLDHRHRLLRQERAWEAVARDTHGEAAESPELDPASAPLGREHRHTRRRGRR